MNARKAQKLRNMLVIIGAFIMFSSVLFEPLLFIGAVVVFSSLVPEILYNKCPHCGANLGRNTGQYCQHCGEPIDQ